MQDQIDKIFEQFDRTGSSIRQASARSDARPQAFPPSRQRRSPASNLCIGSGRVSSNSVDWAPRATRLPRFGMRFSLRDPTQLPGACLARPHNVCTTTYGRANRRCFNSDGAEIPTAWPAASLFRSLPRQGTGLSVAVRRFSGAFVRLPDGLLVAVEKTARGLLRRSPLGSSSEGVRRCRLLGANSLGAPRSWSLERVASRDVLRRQWR